MIYVRTVFLMTLVCITVFGAPSPIIAQIPVSVTLNQEPRIPTPNSNVSFSLISGFTDLNRATISWYVNGSLQRSAVGAKTFIAQSGNGISPRTVRAEIVTQDEAVIVKTAILQPGQVYITWEADTYTPPFFKGRALPTPGSSVRLHADAFLYTSSGNRIPEESLNYKWTINSAVSSLSGVGASDIIVGAPSRYGAMNVSLEVSPNSGNAAGKASVRIESQEPSILLYAHNPNAGAQYLNALSASDTISSNFNTLVLEPFYTAAFSPTDSWLSYTWRVNGVESVTSPDAPNKITLSPTESGDITALVSIIFKNAFSPLVTGEKTWRILIEQAAGNSLFGNQQ